MVQPVYIFAKNRKRNMVGSEARGLERASRVTKQWSGQLRRDPCVYEEDDNILGVYSFLR
jgi:hypothetical protein